jgi:hypothetical protein
MSCRSGFQTSLRRGEPAGGGPAHAGVPPSGGSSANQNRLKPGLQRTVFAPGQLASPERRFGNQKAAPNDHRYRRACPAGAIFGLSPACRANTAPPGRAGWWRVSALESPFRFPNIAPAGQARRRRLRGDCSRGQRFTGALVASVLKQRGQSPHWLFKEGRLQTVRAYFGVIVGPARTPFRDCLSLPILAECGYLPASRAFQGPPERGQLFSMIPVHAWKVVFILKTLQEWQGHRRQTVTSVEERDFWVRS